MTYQAQFLRTGELTERSELFQTFQQAHTHAVREMERRETKPEVVAVVEIMDDGTQGVIHKLMVL